MKKLILALGIFMGLAAQGWTASRTPKDDRGYTLPTIDWVGAVPCNIDASTGTAAGLCASGPAIVYGVIISSVASTNYLVIRDSATPNLTSSTAAFVFANGTNATATGASTTLVVKFPVPLRITNGISVNVNSAPIGQGLWTILYRVQNQSGE